MDHRSSRPISRRTLLSAGAAAVAGTTLGGCGMFGERSGDDGPPLDPVTGVALREPEMLRSERGVLRVTLEAAAGTHEVAGREVTTLGYNGGLPGPTLTLRAGDRLQVHLANGLAEDTNLHVHGLHVSPRGNGDNVFVSVAPGDSFDYDYQLPDDHPPGVYWYHPHLHGLVADQVYGGLYGAIVVEDPSPVDVARERLLVVSDVSLDASGQVVTPSQMEQMMGREGGLVLVNGQVAPRIEMVAGSRERWRVVNACSARFLSLRLDGHALHLVGMDSGRFAEPRATDHVLLLPGNRADLLVTAGRGAGVLRALPYDRGGIGMMGGLRSRGTGPVPLATVAVTTDGAADTGPLPAFDPPRDLRTEDVAGRRELVFATGMGGMGMGGMGMGAGRAMGDMMSFTIDGREFAHDRVDQEVRAGTVEEWTIRNDSPMDHPFHLHVWPMQVLEENGTAHEAPVWQDVVNVPARGSVRVRVAFDDFDGRTVYHCHILDHEDRGMMGVVEASTG